jgi:hypothetical protein
VTASPSPSASVITSISAPAIPSALSS